MCQSNSDFGQSNSDDQSNSDFLPIKLRLFTNQTQTFYQAYKIQLNNIRFNMHHKKIRINCLKIL